MNNEHWIHISVVSDYTDIQIQQSIADCYMVHLWTLATLKEQFLKTLEIPPNQELDINLTLFVYMNELRKHTQRFTLSRAMEKTAAQFRRELRVEEDKIEFPSPIAQEDYNELDIQSRKIWHRYLEQYSGISTTYGMFLLEGEWKNILLNQAREIRVTPSYLPLLWYSVTVKKEETGYRLKFNLHDPTSIQGKRARRKLRVKKV